MIQISGAATMSKKRSGEDESAARRAAYKKDLQRRIHKRVLAAIGAESWSSLAERADIARSTIGSSTIKVAYSIENLVKIARATGRPLEYFVGEEPQQPISDTEAIAAYKEAVVAALGALVEDMDDAAALSAYREIERVVLRARASTPRAGERERDLAEDVVPGLPRRGEGGGAARGRAG